MKSNASRRNFLAAGLGLPAAGLAAVTNGPETAPSPARLLAEPVLRYRTLGKTGLKVTELGFGCMITSDASVIEKAADLGINYFDTARGYQGGNNERMVGAALKGKRKNLVLSTKTHAGTKDAAMKELETSLRELGTDYLDIWYLHAKSRGDQLTGELLEAQQDAKKQGKTRFTGISTHSGQAAILEAAMQTGKIDVVLIGYNFTMEETLDSAIDKARANGIGIVAMKVMAGGFRRAKPGTSLLKTLERDGAMLAALKWVLKNPKVDTTIPSMTDMDQLDDNLKAMAAPFTEADRKLLAAQLNYISPVYCRMCDECTGTCPKGVPVADVLRFLTYAEGYGQFALGRERFRELPAEVAQVRCNLCPACPVTCPYGVRVAERLSRAQELFA
jgi:aryl-alcohol dehydrogenase-like predicted oxidoreductase